MTYLLLVDLSAGNAPPFNKIVQAVREFDPNASMLENNALRLTDTYTGESFIVQFQDTSGTITLQVPDSVSFGLLSGAYALARSLADKFGGTMRDPQLGGPPSLSLAQQEWRKHDPATELAGLFGGKIPSDLRTKLRQRQGLLTQELEIRGSELEIRRRTPGRLVHYFIPILSLGSANQRTISNPVALVTLFGGLMIVILGGIVGGSPIGGIIVLGGVIVIGSTGIVLWKFKRQLLIFPGRGGNLLIGMSSPSKAEVLEFLSSIDRVRFALSRPRTSKPVESTEKEDERTRVV